MISAGLLIMEATEPDFTLVHQTPSAAPVGASKIYAYGTSHCGAGKQ